MSFIATRRLDGSAGELFSECGVSAVSGVNGLDWMHDEHIESGRASAWQAAKECPRIFGEYRFARSNNGEVLLNGRIIFASLLIEARVQRSGIQ